MDVVKLWSSLLANCAIGPTACTTIPTAYFVQGTADVQFFGYANNDNVTAENNNETFSIADSDSNSSCYDKRQSDVVTLAADVGDEEQDEEGDEEQDDDEEDDDDEEEDEDNQPDQHLIPVKIVDELADSSGGDVRLIEVTNSESGEKHRKQTQGKQTQTKIHRNRYSREEYRCSICPYTCTTEKAFLKHSRNCEPNDQNDTDNKQLSLSCPICGKDRKGEESLVLHMKKHKDNKHFCCDICIFKTLQLKKLIQHRRMHTGEKPHLCPFCSYRSARRDNLRSHARRVHKKDNLPCDTFTPRSMILRPSQSK